MEIEKRQILSRIKASLKNSKKVNKKLRLRRRHKKKKKKKSRVPKGVISLLSLGIQIT